jgi:alpha-beta hydrolase superfamily lysophospholipase
MGGKSHGGSNAPLDKIHGKSIAQTCGIRNRVKLFDKSLLLVCNRYMKKLLFPLILSLVVPAFCFAQTGDDFSRLSLKALQDYPYKASPLVINALASETSEFRAYNFSYTSMGLTVTGRLSLPAMPLQNIKGVVLMLRGHQNEQGYYTGKGTEYPARRYLQNGYAVAAPDFLGYGGSSQTPEPAQAHQFYSTVNAVELYLSLQAPRISFASRVPAASRTGLPASFKKIVLWGHSNGGQVAIHFLEIVQKPVPTVLWAPVSLAFPDSLAFYQKNRAVWTEQFKKEKPAQDYSLYTYLGRTAPNTPVLLEQGSKDAAVPQSWSDDFANAVAAENKKRPQTERINITSMVYPGANHNLEPFWNTVLPRDVAFWDAF